MEEGGLKRCFFGVFYIAKAADQRACSGFDSALCTRCVDYLEFSVFFSSLSEEGLARAKSQSAWDAI